MNIVFDMDNTLTDEFGSTARPGIDNLLDKLQKEGHTLILWTGSTRERAIHILKEHRLYYYFQKFIFREDYDPNNQGVHKDIRKVNGDLLIDDDPDEIRYMKEINKKGVQIAAYRKNNRLEPNELVELYQKIKEKKGFFSVFDRGRY